jgi:hypothetical protein
MKNLSFLVTPALDEFFDHTTTNSACLELSSGFSFGGLGSSKSTESSHQFLGRRLALINFSFPKKPY